MGCWDRGLCLRSGEEIIVVVAVALLLLLNVIVSLQYIIVEAPNERTGHFAAEVLQEFSKVGLLST